MMTRTARYVLPLVLLFIATPALSQCDTYDAYVEAGTSSNELYSSAIARCYWQGGYGFAFLSIDHSIVEEQTDANHDGVSQPEELRSIAVSPLEAIGTAHHWTGKRDSNGNLFGYQGFAFFRHARRPIYDVFFVSVP